MRQIFLLLTVLILGLNRAGADPAFPGTEAFAERFESRSAGLLSVHTPRENQLPAVWLLRRSGAALESLTAEMGIDPGGPIEVVFAGDERTFQWVTGGLVPEWGAGAALPSRRLVVVAYSGVHQRTPAELDRILRHEFAHVLLGSLETRIPRWFDEGHAMFRSQAPSREMYLALARAAVLDRLLPLPAIADSFPTSHGLAQLAYAESYDVIRSIQERHGAKALPWILSDLTKGSSFDDAILRGTGLTPAIFAAYWREEVRERYSLLDAFGDSALLWVAAALLVIVGAVYKRVRMVRRRNRMADDELDGPWMGRADYGPSGFYRSSAPPFGEESSGGTSGPEG